MHINFNGVHFTVTAITYNKFKDIFSVIFSDHVISNWIRSFSLLQFYDFGFNRFQRRYVPKDYANCKHLVIVVKRFPFWQIFLNKIIFLRLGTPYKKVVSSAVFDWITCIEVFNG